MGKFCIIRGCPSRGSYDNLTKKYVNKPNVNLFKFPDKYKFENMYHYRLTKIGKLPSEIKAKEIFICSLHFDEKHIIRQVPSTKRLGEKITLKYPQMHPDGFPQYNLNYEIIDSEAKLVPLLESNPDKCNNPSFADSLIFAEASNDIVHLSTPNSEDSNYLKSRQFKPVLTRVEKKT